MQLKKNWLYYGNLLFFLIMMAYVMFSGIGNLSDGEEYAYLYRGMFIAALFMTWLLTQGLVKLVLWIRENKASKPVKNEKLREVLTVCLILAVGTVLRYIVSYSMSYEISEEFSNIFQCADSIMRGTLWTEGKIYCSYLSVFPQYFLYTLVLAGVFSVFGSSIFAAAMVQLFFSGCSLLVLYGIAKSLGGREIGFGAMFFTAVSPVLVLGQRQLSVLNFNTFFFLLSVWMLLSVVKQRLEEEKISNTIILHVLLGMFLAVTVFLVPAAAVLVPFFMLVLVLLLGYEEKEQKKRGLVSQILLAVMMMAVCAAGTLAIRMGTGVFIGKELPSFVHQGGYEMLTSLNMDYNGEQNEEDNLIKENILLETGSADEVHRICKNLAYQRFGQNMPGSVNLLIKKLNRVLGISLNENIIVYWLQNYYYFIGILFAMLFAVHLWQKGPSERILLFVSVNLMVLVLVWFIGEYEISQMLAPLFSAMAAMEIYALFQDKQMVYSLIWREEKLRAEEETSWIDEIGQAVRAEDKERMQKEERPKQETVFRGKPEFEPVGRRTEEKAGTEAEEKPEIKKAAGPQNGTRTAKAGQHKESGERNILGQMESDGQEERRRLEELLEKEMLFDFTLLEEKETKTASPEELFEDADKTLQTSLAAGDSQKTQTKKEPEKEEASAEPEGAGTSGIESTKALRSVENEESKEEIKKLKSHLRSVLEEEDAKEKAARVKELLEIQNEIESMIQVIENTRQITLDDGQEDQREKRRQQIEKAKEQQRRRAGQDRSRSPERQVRTACESRQLEKIFGPSSERKVPDRLTRPAADDRETEKPDRTAGNTRTSQRAVRTETGMRFSETGKAAGRKTTGASAKRRRPGRPVQNSFTKL